MYTLLMLYHILNDSVMVAHKLKLPDSSQIEYSQLHECSVMSPWIGSCGLIASSNYVFGIGYGTNQHLFYSNRQLINISNYHTWLDSRSLIDRNDAYNIAIEALINIGVDISDLTNKYYLVVEQLERDNTLINAFKFRTKKSKQLPLFYVKWYTQPLANKNAAVTPVVSVLILGSNKQIIELRVENGLKWDSPFHLPSWLTFDQACEINKLNNQPVKSILEKHKWTFDEIIHLLDISKTYQESQRDIMLREALLFCESVDAIDGDIKAGNTLNYFVRPPIFGYGGSIKTAKCYYGFNESMHLIMYQVSGINYYNEKDETVIITKDEAHTIALNMIKKYDTNSFITICDSAPIISRIKYPYHKGERKIPYYKVTWRTQAVELEVIINGVDRRITYYRNSSLRNYE